MRVCPVNDVLHVLDHSLPEQSGYAYRGHAILSELRRLGVSLDVVTGPKQGKSSGNPDKIDGILYQRTVVPEGAITSGVTGQARTIAATRKRIAESLRDGQARLIHAHSPCLNGIAAMGHGIPLIYEMRSSWEDAAVSSGTTTEGSLRYRISKMLETFVVRRADAVVVICEGLEMFDLPDQAAVTAVRQRYGLEDAKIIGFFGSFFEWEGVAELIRVLPDVLQAVPGARVLLAGGGRQEDLLRNLVSKLGLEDKVTFAGRVSHADVKAFYGAADVMAFPRVSQRLTDMVTPIKPLEAMAQGAIVVASDVGGHQEMLSHGDTGFLYRAGSREGLAKALAEALAGGDKLVEIRGKARQYVERERQWSVVAQRYVPVYESLEKGRG
jgi:glycosyltransferase involved in cell wall biosynthesis